MRGLAEIINNDSCCCDEELRSLYSNVQRRAANREADTFVFENMLMAYHNVAALGSIVTDIQDKYDTIRSAIISWYYAIYFSSSAMVAAASGSVHETHTSTAKVWHADIVENHLLPYPFNLYLTSLVTKKVDIEIEEYRESNIYDLNTYPSNIDQAHGAIISYLKGTAEYKKWEMEIRVKSSREFKDLGVSDFRKKVARELRDKYLDKGMVNFLIQAFRYRGKANYRDSIFLSYGDDNEEKIEQFTQDLMDVTNAFVRAASFYSSKRVENGAWNEFVTDIENNSQLSIDVDVLKT